MAHPHPTLTEVYHVTLPDAEVKRAEEVCLAHAKCSEVDMECSSFGNPSHPKTGACVSYLTAISLSTCCQSTLKTVASSHGEKNRTGHEIQKTCTGFLQIDVYVSILSSKKPISISTYIFWILYTWNIHRQIPQIPRNSNICETNHFN